MSADIICLRNVEKKFKGKHETQEKTQSSQIKDKLQVNVLNEAVEFITNKFTSMKQTGIKKKKIISVSEISNELEALENLLDRQ